MLTREVPTAFHGAHRRQGTPVAALRVSSLSVSAVLGANLYYVYQHEKLGVFRAVQKLEQLWKAGAIRLSSGDGAQRLYRFARRRALRFTQKERLAAYCRGFGYCSAPPPVDSRPNSQFHSLFTNFMDEVALFWRDKRVSEVMRDRANDPSFGSIATVRRPVSIFATT